MRFIINNLNNDINEYRRRKRNRPNYFLKYFLIWISLILLSTLIYLYIIDDFDVIKNSSLNEPIIKTIVEPIKETVIEPVKETIIDPIKENIVKQLPQRSKLYEEIMNTVSNIPKPLKFVDNFSFTL
jgi:hypothetical protein